jgi:phosphoribosylformylglycinamidine synthase
LVSVARVRQTIWEDYLKQHLGHDWQRLGSVGSDTSELRIQTADDHSLINVRMAEISDRWHNSIEGYLNR